MIKSWEYNRDYMWPAIPKMINILPLQKRCSDTVKWWTTNKIISFAFINEGRLYHALGFKDGGFYLTWWQWLSEVYTESKTGLNYATNQGC